MFDEMIEGTILKNVYFKNELIDYIVFLLLFLIGFFAIKIFHYVLKKHIKKWTAKTATSFDDFLVKITNKMLIPLAYLGVVYLCFNTLEMNPLLEKLTDIAIMAILVVYSVRIAVEFLNYGFSIYWKKRGKDVALEGSLSGILKVLKVVIWGLAITFFLDNLGFKISAVIAGLGIGGVAVALAAQAILGDLFGYFAILFDRPFEVGDFIIIGEYLGTIEHIGIKTTRIRSLGGEELVFSNTDLTNSRLRNYKRMGKRRVIFKLGVTYQTPLAKLKKIPGIVENIIRNVKDTTFDRTHFREYGDFNLVIEIVYYVMSRDYNVYMDIQQEINFGIKGAFEKEGIEFAYPTQTLYVSKSE